MKNLNGFTLVEFVISLAILAVLVTIAIPSFRYLTLSNKLTTSANELLSAVKYARIEAIKRNGTVALCQPTTTMTSLNNACSASTTWTQWGAVAETADGKAMVLQSRSLDGLGSQILIKSAARIDFAGSGIAMTGTTPYNGTIADIYTDKLNSDNHRCLVMTGGSSVRVYSQTGDCP